MTILTRNNVVLFFGEVEKGIFPEADPTRELYKINGNTYSVTDGIEEYEVNSIPEDFEQGKYCYTESNGFYINPDYAEPQPTAEEQLRADIDYIAIMTGIEL